MDNKKVLTEYDLAKKVSEELNVDFGSVFGIISSAAKIFDKMLEEGDIFYIPPFGYFRYIEIKRKVPTKNNVIVSKELKVTKNFRK